MAEVYRRVVQVLSEPIAAFRATCERPMVVWALVIAVLSETAMNLLSIEPDSSGMLGFESAAQGGEGPLQWLWGALVTLGLFWIGTYIFHMLARLMGGRGAHRQLLAGMGFASFPGVIQAPVVLFSQALGVVSLAAFGQVLFAVWMIVLNVLAIREIEKLSTARAIGAFAIGILVIVVIVFILFVLLGLLLAPWVAR